MRKIWGSIPGPLKTAQCCQRLATAAMFLCSPGAKSGRWAPAAYALGRVESLPHVTIAEKMNPFFFETNILFLARSLPKLLSCFFCSVQRSNLISRNFITMRCNNTGSPTFDVFCLNCIFVINAAVKQLLSRNFLNCDVSAVTTAARKI